MASLSRRYGRERPGRHLAAMLVTYLLCGYAVWAIFQNTKPWTVLLWVGAAIVVHDFVVLPLYTAAYRLVWRLTGAEPGRRGRVLLVQHLAAPAVVSLLLLAASLPLVLSLSEGAYRPTTGMTQEPYLGRWLAVTAALFVVSAVVGVIRARR